jgi:hypothetical protein
MNAERGHGFSALQAGEHVIVNVLRMIYRSLPNR